MRTARGKLNENETPNTIEDFEAMAEQTKSPIEATFKTIITPPKREEKQNGFEVEETNENFNRPRMDRFSRWLSEYAGASEHGFYLQVSSLPDFVNNPRASVTPTFLGYIPFNKFSMISAIQELNGNRGGRFSLMLVSENGDEDEDSYIEVLIPNPKIEASNNAQQNENPQLMQVLNRVLDRIENLESKKSDSMEEMKKTLELMGMMRSAFGVNETQKSNSVGEAIAKLPQDVQIEVLSAMNPANRRLQSQVAVQEAEAMATFIQTLAEKSAKLSSGNEENKSIVREIFEMIREPESLKLLGVIIENVTKAGAYAATPKENRFFGAQPIPQPVQQVQNPQVIQPEIIDAQPVNIEPQIVEVPAIEKGDYNVMMDAIIEVLQSDEPITLNHEILVGLKEDYPAKFPIIKRMVKNTPFEQLKEFIKGFLPDEDLYLLEDEKIIARLQELHNLIINES